MRQLFLLAAFFAAAALPVRAQEFDYSLWQRVLGKYVNDAGRVDYAALKAHSDDLDRFAEQIAARSPLSSPRDFPNRPSQMAYWINAYNALVMKGVVENWPVESVLKIGVLPHSFFWGKKFTVGGRATTLDDIEKGELRKKFSDPRIHFALTCASNSCPPLRRKAFAPEQLEEQLDSAARDFINSPRGMRIEASANRIKLSRIFKWYGSDFEAAVREKNPRGASPAVLIFIRRYASGQNRKALDSLHNPRIEFFDYDWRINYVRAAPS